MALVRRADLRTVGNAINGALKLPQQPAPPDGTPAAAPAVAPAITPASVVGDAEAAAVASKGAGAGTVLVAFLLVAAGTGVAYALNRWGNQATPFKIGSNASAYAGIVVFSAAVERFLEPFSHWLPGAHANNAYERVVAAHANGDPQTPLRTVAAAKAALDRATANRTVLLWGLATAVATAAAGASGFYLLHMIAASGWDLTAVPTWVDALVTGLVVGTGTKPLHDLIVKAQDSGK